MDFFSFPIWGMGYHLVALWAARSPLLLLKKREYIWFLFLSCFDSGSNWNSLNYANLVVFNFSSLAALGLAVGVVVGVIVLGIMVCCVVHHVKRKNTPNREAGVEIPMSTSTQPGVVQEPHQPAENTFSSPSVGYAPTPTNPPPPEYPYPLEPPPPYPGKEGEPQYPPPGQSYPWQQSGGSAPVLESP